MSVYGTPGAVPRGASPDDVGALRMATSHAADYLTRMPLHEAMQLIHYARRADLEDEWRRRVAFIDQWNEARRAAGGMG